MRIALVRVGAEDEAGWRAMQYSDDDIRKVVGDNAFRNGELYRRQARVMRFAWREGPLLEATVKGSGINTYSQIVRFTRRTQGGLAIIGTCTCPVGVNCKHVAASLLVARSSARTDVGDGPPAASPVAKPWQAALGSKGPPEHTIVAVSPELSPELAAWFDSLTRAEAQTSDEYPADVAQRLVYVLTPEERREKAPRLSLQIKSTRLLKSGVFSTSASDYNPANLRSYEPPRHLRPIDLSIQNAINMLPRHSAADCLGSEAGAAILGDILATGRARWRSIEGPALVPGPPLKGRIEWAGAGEASLRPVLALDDASGDAGEVVLLNAAPPVYVRPADGLIGAVETGLAPKVAFAVLDAPAVPAAQIGLLGLKFRGASSGIARAAPPDLEPPIVVSVPPAPVLKLTAASVPMQIQGYYYYGSQRPREMVPVARALFRYDAFDAPAAEKGRVLQRMKGLRPVEIRRHGKAEKAALKGLAEAGLVKLSTLRRDVPAENKDDLTPEEDVSGWLDFLYDDVPKLRDAGWRIDILDDFPIKLLRGDGAFDAEVRESSGIDWFELDLGVIVDGERIDLIEPLIRFLSSGDVGLADLAALDHETAIHLQLQDGRFLSVPLQRILPIIETLSLLLSGLGGANGATRLRFSALDASVLAALEAASAETGAVWRGGERVRALGDKLRSFGGIADVTLPETFKAVLRPYQAKGIAWLSFLAEAGLGGVLADDMGLGKTVQALGLIAIEKAAGRLTAPVLVIAPTSLMVNWRREAEKFSPDLKVLTLQGLDRRTRFDAIETSDVVLTTYPLIARDHEVLSARDWHMILLDEAQTIKNPNATTTKLIHGLKSRHRFCLSGTPLENHLGELWSLFHFVSPGFLGDLKSFGRLWRTPIEKEGNSARAKMLAARVKPFLLRRTKDEVATDLPPKTEIVERVEFGAAQRDLYESVRLTMHGKVVSALAEKGLARSRIVVLDALLKLRQACCDPRLVKLARTSKTTPGSAKLERLMEIVTELLDQGRKILIFSQFTSMLELIRPLLDEEKVPYALLTGDTVDRESQVIAFQDGKVPVFLVSLKAGGVGLNLTAADTVILYDPWWNPAVENQAIDRAHRIGQDKPVFVHKLVATGTIEEKIEILKARKQALAESIFDHDGAPTLSITEDDIAMLFAES